MKYLIIKIGIFLLKIIYFIMKLFPTKNKITMISRQSNKISIDFKLIKKEIESHRKYNVVALCKKLNGKENASILELFKYGFNLLRQMYNIATSKVVIIDSYCIAISIFKHKKSLKVIQIWHSVGTMKKFGYDILDQEEGNSSKMANILKMHKNYDYVLCAGEGYKEDLARQFNCKKEIIKILPLPRIDLLNDKEYIKNTKDKILKCYPKLSSKKNILYCPTFRKDETKLGEAVNKLIDSVNYKKYNLIIKLHPLSNINITDKRVIIDNKFSSIDMASVSNFVITDYSCILYEVGILNKALYFYCFDYDEYNKNRSLNIDYFNELPGIKSKNIESIISSIEKNKYDYKELNNFINKYIEPGKNNTKKLYDLICNCIEK